MNGLWDVFAMYAICYIVYLLFVKICNTELLLYAKAE